MRGPLCFQAAEPRILTMSWTVHQRGATMGNKQVDSAPAKVTNGPFPPVRETVLAIWQRTMGPKGWGANADLCRIGVGVKRLFRMLDEIEHALGTKIPPVPR